MGLTARADTEPQINPITTSYLQWDVLETVVPLMCSKQECLDMKSFDVALFYWASPPTFERNTYSTRRMLTTIFYLYGFKISYIWHAQFTRSKADTSQEKRKNFKKVNVMQGNKEMDERGRSQHLAGSEHLVRRQGAVTFDMTNTSTGRRSVAKKRRY